MALDCKAMLHLLCLKQLQKNSVPALTFLYFTKQAEQRGSAASKEAKKPSCSASRTANLMGRHSTAPCCLKEGWLFLQPTALHLALCWVSCHTALCAWLSPRPHQSQWAHSWSWAGATLLLPLPKAACWDPPLKAARLMDTLLGNASTPGLSWHVLRSKKPRE